MTKDSSSKINSPGGQIGKDVVCDKARAAIAHASGAPRAGEASRETSKPK